MKSLIEFLWKNSISKANNLAYRFLETGDVVGPYHEITWLELADKVKQVAALLQTQAKAGDRALLLYKPGLDFIIGLYACFAANIIAVPSYPPEFNRINRTLPRLQAIISDASAKIVLTSSDLLKATEPILAQVDELKLLHWIATDDLDNTSRDWKEFSPNPKDVAYLQYTSGSTGDPKGVMVTHKNLIVSCLDFLDSLSYDLDFSHHVSWLPVFHDMGLIWGLMTPIVGSFSCTFMAPTAFLQKPSRWLEAISHFRGTVTASPSFGYDLCLRKIDEQTLKTLDLSSLKVSINAAEPVRAETIAKFQERFKPVGFKTSTMCPGFGLAENTLQVTVKSPTVNKPIILALSKKALEQNQVLPATDGDLVEIVGCGSVKETCNVRIVNPETFEPLLENQVGEIWLSGLLVTNGYWERDELNKEVFQARINGQSDNWLRTGDLGFIQNAELFITGRYKDLIIVRGRNIYPQDIEKFVEQTHKSIRPGCVIAFSIEVEQEESIVVVAEVELKNFGGKLEADKADEILTLLRTSIIKEFQVEVQAIVLIEQGSINKTSSGKLQRKACRKSFLEGTLSQITAWNKESFKNVSTNTLSSVSTSNNSVEINITSDSLSRNRANEIINWLRNYAGERINSQLMDERRCIAPYIVLDFGKRGILGMIASEKYGGTGLNNTDTVRVAEQLAAIDLTLSSFVLINNTLGIHPIQSYATKSLCEEILPDIARGRDLVAFALTEESAGSNPRALLSTAEPCGKGKWKINGVKYWSGSSAWSNFINVFVYLKDSQSSLGNLTGFVVPSNSPGLRFGPEALTTGLRAMVQNSVIFQDVVVSEKQLLGQIGQGMEVANSAMYYARLVIAALSLGGLKRCSQLMLRYASRRQVSTGRLLDNPVTINRLNELNVSITALQSLVKTITGFLDKNINVPVECFTICKISGSEMLWTGADYLVQLLGGRGYIESNIAPQIMRDARILRIFEGPTETLNMFLGSRLINQGKDFYSFIEQQLGCSFVANKIKEAASEIVLLSKNNSYSPSIINWVNYLLGELASYGFLWACVEKDIKLTPTKSLEKAKYWIQVRFEETVLKAINSVSKGVLSTDITDTIEEIYSYDEAIGDIEQTLAGEDHKLDNFLVKDPLKKQHYHSLSLSSVEFLDKQTIQETEEKTLNTTLLSKKLPVNTQVAKKQRSYVEKEFIKEFIKEWISKKLKISIKDIILEKEFSYYSIDSVTGVMLAQELEDLLGFSIDPTFIWDHPTLNRAIEYLYKNANQNLTENNISNPSDLAKEFPKKQNKIDDIFDLVDNLPEDEFKN